MRDNTVPKKWRVLAIQDFGTCDQFVAKLENVMNELEEQGYDVHKPQPIGKHYFVVGRLPDVEVKPAKKSRRKRGDSEAPPLSS